MVIMPQATRFNQCVLSYRVSGAGVWPNAHIRGARAQLRSNLGADLSQNARAGLRIEFVSAASHAHGQAIEGREQNKANANCLPFLAFCLRSDKRLAEEQF